MAWLKFIKSEKMGEREGYALSAKVGPSLIIKAIIHGTITTLRKWQVPNGVNWIQT